MEIEEIFKEVDVKKKYLEKEKFIYDKKLELIEKLKEKKKKVISHNKISLNEIGKDKIRRFLK